MNKSNMIYIALLLILIPSLLYALPQGVELGLAAMDKDGRIPSAEQINSFEQKLGRSLSTFNWFMGFNADTNELPAFPLEKLKSNLRPDIIPMLTLEPWGKTTFDSILAGKLDIYFHQFAKDIHSYGGKIRFRFGHEMIQNDVPEAGDPHPGWYSWQDNPKYVEVFKYIHQIFKAEKADVEFVWSPNYHMYDYTILAKYYPGPEYVDWIGLDGYNWAGEDFDGIFKHIYLAITRHPEIFGTKPMMIAECGMGQDLDKKRNKANWIKDAFAKLRSDYPAIKAFYWFNVNKEHDWRLDSSDDAWEAFKTIFGGV